MEDNALTFSDQLFDFDFHSPLVGRQRELNRLTQLWRQASAGRSHMAIIAGESGIGKTTLVAELAARIGNAGGRVLFGHCYDQIPGTLHSPWLELLDGISDPEGVPLQPSNRSNFFESVAERLLANSTQTATLIVLEDFQWADETVITLLRYVSRRCIDQKFLFVLTVRTGDHYSESALYAQLPDIVREARAMRINLPRLEQPDITEWIDNSLELPAADASELATFLSSYTEGIPLFIREMVGSLYRNDMLRLEEGKWTLKDLPAAREPTPVPEMLRQLVEGRLRGLEPVIRERLQFIAVIGQTVSVDRWTDLVGIEESALIETIESGLARGILSESARDGHPAFRHALFRETLYREISGLRRRMLHRRIANFLIPGTDSSPEVVALHLYRAGDPRAVDWLVRAADDAERGFAMLTAVEHLELVLGMLDDGSARLPQEERGWLLLRIGSLHRQTLLPASRDYLSQALAVARAVGDRALEVQALWGQGLDVCLRGRNGLAALDEALAISTSLPADEREGAASDLLFGMPSDPVVARGVLVICCAIFGALERATTYAAEYLAIPIGDARRDRSIAGQVHMGLAFVYEAAGGPAKARQELQRALEIHAEINSTWGQAVVVQDLLLNTLYFYADERDERERVAVEVERLWQAVEHGVTRLPPRFGLLSLLYLRGEWDEARLLAEPFLEDEYVVQALIYPVLASIARYQGRSDDAWRIIAYLFPDGPATPERSVIMSYAIPTQQTAIDLALDADDFELAECWIEASERWLGSIGESNAFVIGRSQLAARRGRLALLKDDIESGLRQADAALSTARDPYQPVALVEALLLAGQCHSALGEIQAAADTWHEALELARACDAACLIAAVELHLARLEAERGENDRAREHSTRSLATIDRLGARLLLRGLEPMMEEKPVSTDLPDGAHITPRELEIGRLLVTGKSNKEIADQLSISVRTVERHVSNLYEKTGAHGRAAITAYILSNNLI